MVQSVEEWKHEEAVGPNFSLDLFQEARAETLALIESLAENIKPGMKESDARELFVELRKEKDIEKLWHQPQIRFGKNTCLPFGRKGEDETLKEDDIFFIDLGLVFRGHEGDIGRTFCTGNSSELRQLRDFSEDLFQRTRELWLKERLSGSSLYSFVKSECEKNNYEFIKELSGHRLSEFPHYLHSKKELMNYERTPTEGKWVLEIQVMDPELQRGAFFEDILE